MPRPAGDTRRDQEGFIIIEVLVSAIILAIVAGAVLTLITATTRSAASQRDRSVAYDLAQADQARLRTMRITKLNGLEEASLKSIEANGATYTVESKGVFVNNKAGGVSCTEENDSADYIQLTSTVSSPALNSPVTIQSVVSPSTGSIDPTHGTLAVQTLNAAEEPVSGVSVQLEQTAYGRTTEAQGCANFADLPAGAYNVIFKAGTLVNEYGETEETKTGQSVSAGRSPSRAVSHWDTPGTIEAEFFDLEPGTGTLQPAAIDSMWVVPQTGGKEKTFGKPSGERISKLVAVGLYPFKGVKYTIYAGSCSTNNPNPTSSKPENNVGIGSVEVIPGKTVTKQIRVPALGLTVENSSKEPVSGATVTVTDKKCKLNGTSLKRILTTNAGGHLAKTATGPTEPGLPFGTYEICASKKIGTKTFGAKLEVGVENFSATGTVKSLKIVEGGAACP